MRNVVGIYLYNLLKDNGLSILRLRIIWVDRFFCAVQCVCVLVCVCVCVYVCVYVCMFYCNSEFLLEENELIAI